MSSTKSSRIVNSHIVETNASGIVTIVIDDDNEESNYNISDEESVNEYNPLPKASRPAIGVRTPIPTPGSPKFINSENCQNVLIKENKTNVIVVSSGRSHADGSPFRSSLSPTSSCCSSDSLPSELTTHHNIVSKTQTHYVVINKPKPTASATATSQMPSYGSHMSSPTLEYSSKSSPTKLRLWTQPSNHSTPRSPQVIVSTRTRSHALLPPEDIESDCMDDKTFFKYLNLIPKEELRSKPRKELNSCWPLRKVNKILKPDTDSEGKLLLANFKLLREPMRVVPNNGPKLNENKLRWYREAQKYNERLQKFKADLPLNETIRFQIQSELELLHKRLMAEKQRQTIEEEKFRRLKAQENNQRIQREELRQELENYFNAFEISSLMGRRVRLSLVTPTLSAVENFEKFWKRIESHCNHMDILSVSAPQNTKLSTRITRSTTGFAGIDRMWGPRNDAHQYSFTRRQRLERYYRIDTGLNWRSRLVKKQCRRIDVEVAKITRCPCCLEVVEPEWGHSCRDSDEESIPEVSSVNDSDFCVQSESNFNEEEVISTNSEIMASGDVATCQCGRYECDCDCVDSSQDTTRVSNSQKTVDKSVDRTVVVSQTETFIPFKIEIEDKIIIHKMAVLNDKTSDNKNNIINSNSIERNVDSLPVKRINEQNLRTNNKKIVKQNDLNDDIVIISEVSADSRPQSGEKRLSEPDIIERYLTPNLETNPSIKRKFCEKRLRSHSRNNSEEIIVKKLK